MLVGFLDCSFDWLIIESVAFVGKDATEKNNATCHITLTEPPNIFKLILVLCFLGCVSFSMFNIYFLVKLDKYIYCLLRRIPFAIVEKMQCQLIGVDKTNHIGSVFVMT